MRLLRFIILFCIPVFLFSCKHKDTLFEKIPSSYSGVTFANTIIENDTINPLDKLNIYNGGGVGIGDFNNDGRPDLYFVGNAVSNKLYLNKGELKFQDVTKEAGAEGSSGWGRGVAVVDINNDGLLDIYVCYTLLNDSVKRRNLLYVNQGIDKQGIPHFKEMGKEYGLDINVHSTMASFFDYDNDGDLDMYLTVNEAAPNENTSSFRPISTDGSRRSTGRLYRNDWDPVLKHGVYHNVSKQAGILIEGYGHAASIADINRDGWKDIYVTNDFLSNNILYINNHDGTFTDRTREYFKHTANSAMGQDIEDINNDGLADVFELDMSPEDNYRRKMFMSSNTYQLYQNFDYYGYQYQYNRNTLQINQGPRPGQNDSVGAPAFSETSFLSGTAQTDWSWCPLITDFDNDGYRDIVITNGYPRDVTDHDFTTFRAEAYLIASKKQILDQIPIVKIPNYAFKNGGNLEFADVSKNWGLTEPSFSNGAAYADLDGDGDMDMVINNIDDEAFVYKNTLRDKDKAGNHYLQIQFKGGPQNINGIGAWADIYYDKGKHQVYENTPFRGYLSTIQNIAHFGLGRDSLLDSVVIRWENGKKQTLKHVKADRVLTVSIADAHENYSFKEPTLNSQSLFREVTRSVGVTYRHKEDDLADFNIQKLLPHKLSQYTPAVAVGDVDGNGFDDMVVGGTTKYPAQLLLQQANGKFVQRPLAPEQKQVSAQPNLSMGLTVNTEQFKDEGLLLFDADGDGDLDLYVASGGYEKTPNSAFYQDRLYLNDGKGNFKLQEDALPSNTTSKLCVKAIDFNKDGRLDLFVSGRVEPWSYPKPVSSIILRNDSKDGHVKFTDVTATVAKDLKNIGLVCDATFSDFDNDGWPDLILTGEWMPITFLKNDRGVFKNVTSGTGISDKLGWWNTIAAGDFNHDGKTDYIVGNTGLNTFFKASEQYPVYITAKDFDKNGSYDAFPSVFLKDQDGKLKEFPAYTRDDIVKQMISMRVKFQNYKSFATATMDSVITPAMREGAVRLKANILQSCYLQNEGNGKFKITPLPIEAQMSQLDGIVVDDFDGDGNLDVAISGNDFGTDVSTGRYDAFNGLLLKGDGRGGFKALSLQKSGLYIPGDGKALVKLRGAKGNYMIAATQNRDAMKVFELKRNVKSVALKPLDMFATIRYKNGKTGKMEFYNGTSFLSQSGRFFNIDQTMQSVSVTDSFGHTRNIPLN
ncbi:VCBS repeat-containing protein [Mucilaginibacter sp. L3T2-6]|uniref:VCBS repeat-containing protein n=1 Tax=Mucilaginibacter sp. L3T2-6 TaxID=3062491 RepID=UPI0026757B2C|nr:VCBS repeat-containing protein [Mucilaginibacter sp. L3T2-6]MDO3642548.1 VCBS repeat-containing protein [Mucilaginibacter sp. L3T2-6]MDV6215056.1 VCBS repeat-containing protein [Mucilaginibacter sp. L3T2-6]